MDIQDIGNNIRRYMKLQGLSISYLATKMGIGTATISNILNSKSEPRSSTLIKFSDALGVSLNDLLCESPKLKSLRFRTIKILSAREKAERDQILSSTAQWLKDYQDLEDMLGDHREYKFKGIKSKKIEEIVKQVRGILELDPAEPVYDISDCIDKAGIKLRICNFGFKKTFGLSVSDKENGPAIIVNSESGLTVERQIFTVAHELGHLLMHSNSYSMQIDVDQKEDVKKQEEDANAFAGHFLLPDEALLSEWEEAKGEHWIDAVLKIKKKYKVSYLTVLVRLSQIDGKLIVSELLKRFSMDYNKLYDHDLKNHYEPDALENLVAERDPDSLSRFDFIEGRYARLVRIAYEKNLISISRAGELLKKSILEMRDLVKSWQDISINV